MEATTSDPFTAIAQEIVGSVWTFVQGESAFLDRAAAEVVVRKIVAHEVRKAEQRAVAQCDVTDRVVRRVAELPDRTSPADWPEAMLVTADELREIVGQESGRALAGN